MDVKLLDYLIIVDHGSDCKWWELREQDGNGEVPEEEFMKLLLKLDKPTKFYSKYLRICHLCNYVNQTVYQHKENVNT
jgi:hypothetical protein